MDYLKDHYYAYTVRILRKPKLATSHDYDVFFAHINRWVTVWEKELEMKNDVIHYHGVISVSPLLYRKKLRLHNFHLFLKRIYDMNGWKQYIVKTHDSIPKYNLFKRHYPEYFNSKDIV